MDLAPLNLGMIAAYYDVRFMVRGGATGRSLPLADGGCP